MQKGLLGAGKERRSEGQTRSVAGGSCGGTLRLAESIALRVGSSSLEGDSNAGRGRRPKLARWWLTAAIVAAVLISKVRPVEAMWSGASALSAVLGGGGICNAL